MKVTRRLITVGVTVAVGMLGVSSLATFAATPQKANRTEVIVTSEGPIRGFQDDGMRKFLGIPYAAPPVGDLRWRAPQPHAPWSAPLDATAFGNTCVQTNTFVAFSTPSNTEDCLYLNVFTPISSVQDIEHRNKSALKPVMVWIYGGGLSNGATNWYDPSYLVKQGDIVFVSMNYRLNILGFFSHPAIDKGQEFRANYGIMDQQAALKWVQNNIEKFGGDPKNVTIFGEFAGASSTYYNVISPTAAGLFHHAITESTGWTDISTYDVALARGQQFAAAVGCGSDDSPATAQCLRSLSVQQLIDSGFVARGPIRTLDGKILTLNTLEALSSGQFNRVDLMIGTNRDEFTWFNAINEITTGIVLTPNAYIANIQNAYGSAAPAVLEEYPLDNYETPSNALSAVQTDSSWPCQCRRAIRLLREYVPVWGYLFNDRTAPTYMPEVSFPYKAGHTSEIQYVFKDFHGATGVVNPLNPAQKKLSRTMVSYWTSFATTGNPNSPKTPDWPLDTNDDYQLLQLPNATPTSEFSQIHNCDFWDSL